MDVNYFYFYWFLFSEYNNFLVQFYFLVNFSEFLFSYISSSFQELFNFLLICLTFLLFSPSNTFYSLTSSEHNYFLPWWFVSTFRYFFLPTVILFLCVYYCYSFIFGVNIRCNLLRLSNIKFRLPQYFHYIVLLLGTFGSTP